MAKKVKKKWVRLKRFIQKLKIVDPNVGTGDGGLMTDKIMEVIGNKHQTDTTFIIQDTSVVAQPKN